MAGAAGEADRGCLRVDFDTRLKLEFLGSRGMSNAGPLAFRELDDALGLSELAGQALVYSRTGAGASASQMGRFETGVLARADNLAALADLSSR
jgi:hypothetical protein